MTTYFNEPFAGSGALGSLQPPINLHPSVSWQQFSGSNALAEDGAGFVVLSGGTNISPQAIYHIGIDNYDWGTALPPSSLYGPVVATFKVRTPTSLTGTGLDIIGIKLNLNGVLIQAGLNHYQQNQWWLSMTGAPGQLVTLSPNTVYNLTATFQTGASSVTVTELGITQNSTTAFTSAVGLSNVYACVTETGALGPITISSLGGSTPTALVAADTPLGNPAALATSTPYAAPSAICSGPPLLGACGVLAQNNFTGLLGDVTSLYVMDLITPGGTVRVPVSSWQATLQTGASNYVQCVVPACTAWATDINAATAFVINRRAVLPNGQAVEAEMARAPADTVVYDRGTTRHTCTISGYSTAFEANTDPAVVFDRTLTGVRSTSSGARMRVRCNIDWLLRPGQRAWSLGVPMVVGYINYYVPSSGDAYMDVGEQA